jgi:sulfite oxidase
MPHTHRDYDPDALNRGVTLPYTPDDLVTPAANFFRRNHAAPPSIDLQQWRLVVDGLVAHPAEFTRDQLLTQFPRVEVTASLVCAGLRREEFAVLGSLNGELPWLADAASTGRWSGIRLADLLRAMGRQESAAHVHFTGLDAVDRDGARFGFGASIALDKALSDEVVLATHLNGAPLPIAHGFPLRALVPGWIGARSVKWLGRITVSDHPSTNYFQSKAYRVLRTARADAPRDVTTGEAMDRIPRNCVILEPSSGATLPVGPCRVRGWAIGDGAQPITAVELSADGSTWQHAAVTSPATAWSWAFWEGTVEITPGTTVLLARATDAAGTMPSDLRDCWNVKGYGNNSWFRVPVQVG